MSVLVDDLMNPPPECRSDNQDAIKAELIQQIPFEVASEGVTICIDQMTMNEQWPLALAGRCLQTRSRRPAQGRSRSPGRRQKGRARAQDRRERPGQRSTGFGTNSTSWFRKHPGLYPRARHHQGDGRPGQDALQPENRRNPCGAQDYGGTTLGELLAFMHAYNLRFARPTHSASGAST